MPYFYAEIKGFNGVPRSILYTKRPSGKQPEGGKVKWVMEPKPIDARHNDLCLNDLRHIYGSKPGFRSVRKANV